MDAADTNEMDRRERGPSIKSLYPYTYLTITINHLH